VCWGTRQGQNWTRRQPNRFLSQICRPSVDPAVSVTELAADVDPFMLHVYAALAEKERALISERTKAALQAARKKGTRLGSPIAAQTAAKARATRSTYARAASASARAVVRDVQASGVTTLKGIAAALQARGVRTPRGNVVWAPAQVARLLS
jgi:DNA invertase Pin-like site-specific DNA recombinase